MTSTAQLGRESRSIPACPVCGSGAPTAYAFNAAGNRIYRCATCTVEFLYPQPTDQQLGAIYSSTYFIGAGDEKALQRAADLKRATARLYLESIRPFVHAQQPRLLELGCGHGDFLLEAQAVDFTVEGLEYSPDAVNRANQRLGTAAVRVGSLETSRLEQERYDLIAGFDVIEHVRDPEFAMRCLYPALRRGGIIAFATPSLDSWSRQLLGRYWMEYKTEHITYFNRRSLEKLFRQHGFADIRFLSNYKMLSVDYICEHFFRYPVPVITPILRALRRLLPNSIAYRPIKVVASGTMVLARKPV